MALVAYDYGSDSEEEEDEKPHNENESSISKVEIVSNSTITQKEIGISPDTSDEEVHLPTRSIDINSPNDTILSNISDDEETYVTSKTAVSLSFETLPQKKEMLVKTPYTFEDKVEDFIPKANIPVKERAKVRITVPALSDFDNLKDEEPSAKKLKPSVKGSGLLSLLPPVRCLPLSNKSFIPNILTQKNKPSSEHIKKSKPLIPDSVRKKKELKSKIDGEESDDGDIDLPETFDDELWQKTCGKVVKKDIIEEEIVNDEPIINLAPEAVEPYQGLDNTAFKELVGKSSRIPRNIKLIDVNEDELVADKDLWMTKSLTDPEFVPKKDVEDPVDPTKRKKHHITYLAQQAKANEQELQSQWSSSKFNRNQTRAKYGF